MGAAKKVLRGVTAVATGGLSEVALKARKVKKQQKAAKEALRKQEADIREDQRRAQLASVEKLKKKKQFQDSLQASGGNVSISDANVKSGNLFGN